MKITVIALFGLLGAASAASAVPLGPPCTVQGRVVDQRGAPVAGARVEIVGTTFWVLTDDRGEFCLSDPVVSPFQVLVTAASFTAQSSDPLTSTGGQPVVIAVRLFPRLTEHIVVAGREDSLVGVARSASEGTISARELGARPVLRSADVLEAVPGVAMTQHSTGGHAPIVLLRGYNLDHGTDFATFLEGIPINLPSHAHGQGYSDLNFLIPELIDSLTFQKGPYAASVGDFGTAGASTIELKRTLDTPLASFELGSFSQVRAMTAASTTAWHGTLMAGIDGSHTDGPSVRPDAFRRLRGMVRYAHGDRANGWIVSVLGYGASWFGSDGYPRRALDQGWISRYGSLDTSDGGTTSRYLGSVERRWSKGASVSTLTAFGQSYGLDLRSNLTFYTHDPVRGDQIHQRDRRISTGASFGHSRAAVLLGRPGELHFGAQGRYDSAGNALFNTMGGAPSFKRNDSGVVSPATVYDLAIDQISVGPYAEARVSLTDWARTTLGVRADLFGFRASTEHTVTTPRSQTVFSPKAGMAFGPWRMTEIYANIGRGFHSNHAAGVVMTGATPIVRTLGAEVGIRTSVVPGLQTSVAFWRIDSDSELVYLPELGFTEPSRPGRRYGIEWLNFWRPVPWLTIDADLALSQARFTTDPQGIGTQIPDAIVGVYSAGLTVADRAGWTGAVRGRYLGRRPLIEDGSITSTSSFVINTQLGKAIGRRWQVILEGFNLLGRKYDDITYYFATRLRDPGTGDLESAAAPDFVTHPAEPRSARLKISVRF